MSSTHRPMGSLVGAESDTENRGGGLQESDIYSLDVPPSESAGNINRCLLSPLSSLREPQDASPA